MREAHRSHVAIAERILARPMQGWYWTKTHWRPDDVFKLEVLCEADAPLEGSADAIGRTPTSIAHHARTLRMPLPKEWATLIAPKRTKKKPSFSAPLMAYPYVSKATEHNAILLEVNNLVPKSMHESIRADVCQEMMVAILEGRTTIEQLKARGRGAAYFIRRFWKQNHEDAGRAISFSIQDGHSYDEIAASQSARDWRYEQDRQAHNAYGTLRTFTAPTQLEAAWRDQVGGVRLHLNQLGHYMDHDEAEELMRELESREQYR